jgi:hypothetical protein
MCLLCAVSFLSCALLVLWLGSLVGMLHMLQISCHWY